MELKTTTQFKKDLKRYKHDEEKLEELKVVLAHLEYDGNVPAKYSPHLLTGNYKGCMECHVKGDFLLIWMDTSQNIIKLLRLGSHSEVF